MAKIEFCDSIILMKHKVPNVRDISIATAIP